MPKDTYSFSCSDEGPIVDHEQLKSYITSYYENVFGEPNERNFSMDKSLIHDILKVSKEKNALPVTMEMSLGNLTKRISQWINP
jgi:hypothetical protein